ncbi:MAG: polyphosphate kinase 2 family protein [Tissierellia bacterium]|nr:polyphosphate kinase 2 family protein [Tissierellia bacterium]
MDIKKYQVKTGQKVNLKNYPTSIDDQMNKKETKKRLMPDNLEQMRELQDRLYAEDKYGVVMVLQAMDAAGKDGAIKHVMTALNPQGTKVTSFKVPTRIEMNHDYLWRISKALPARGEIGIFNRSHYEDVIVTKVHDNVDHGKIPEKLITEDIWTKRYGQINNFEKYLVENGFKFIKIFLHLSKDEQKDRLLSRINNPDKNWKFSKSDIYERAYWEEYQNAYEEMLENTSTKEAPWYVVPADRKWFSRYLISEIVLNVLQEINPQYPSLNQEDLANLEQWKVILEKEEENTLRKD